MRVFTLKKKVLTERKAFDQPYLLTMGKDFVHYQLFPATVEGHRVNLVKEGHVWFGRFHCCRCGLLGSLSTLQDYPCT